MVIAMTSVSRHRVTALLIASVVTSAALAGCGSKTEGTATTSDTAKSEAAQSSSSESSPSSAAAAAGSSDECATVSAPLTAIDPHDPSEPRLSIPEPAGWERITSQDSDIIRYVIANKSLTADSFTPNVVVTLEHVTGTSFTPQDVLDQQVSVLKSQANATDVDIKPTKTCGAPAETISYNLPAMGNVPARPARGLLVAAPFGGDTWSATLTAQAINSDDPTYQQDVTTILEGFQMVAPGS
jgi:hypothetical protein